MGGVCCVGVLLILAKTIAQAITTPELVSDSEDPTGTTVCGYKNEIDIKLNWHVPIYVHETINELILNLHVFAEF